MDSGLDETSCFFADDDGLEVEHGHLFDGVRVAPDGNVSLVLDNYSYAYDMTRRKVQKTKLLCLALFLQKTAR